MSWQHEGLSIQASTVINASPIHAWHCWADLDTITRWFTQTATGESKVGKMVTWGFDPFFGPPHAYDVAEVKEHEKYVLSYAGGAIELSFEDRGKACGVTLAQSGFSTDDAASEEVMRGCESGWQLVLALQKYYCENFYGQHKQELLVTRKVNFHYPAVYEQISDALTLSGWFDTTAGRPETALALTGREAMWRWDTIGGELECKAFTMGGDQYLALRAVSFSREYYLSSLKQDMEASLDRLVKRLHLK